MVSSDFFFMDFLAFFGAFFMVSEPVSVPLAAGAAPLSAPALSWARAGVTIKARAVAAMISLRMRKPPLLFLFRRPHHNGAQSIWACHNDELLVSLAAMQSALFALRRAGEPTHLTCVILPRQGPP